MRKELENIQIIEQYLRNELSSEDKITFEEKLKSDNNLREEVELQRKVIKGIERVGVKKSIQTASRRYNNRRRGFFLGLFVAVIISGVVGINFLSNNPEPNEIISVDVTELAVDKENEENKPIAEAFIEQKMNSSLVSLPKKSFQYFTINSSKEETITGAEGTKITFKANSFNVPKNSSIKIRLKEYYKMSDIAFSNLTTETTDGKLLETGGMLYLDALVSNKKVGLKKNTFFDIKFPFDKKKKDMILFDGKTKNKNVVWEKSEVQEIELVEDVVSEVFESKVFTIVEKMPEFSGGISKMMEFMRRNIKYPASAKAQNISGKVYVNFIVDGTGDISSIRVIRGVNNALDQEAIRVISSMPKWNPGMQRGVPVDVSFNIPINFVLDGSTPSYTPEEIKYYSDSLKKAQKADAEDNLFGDNNDAQKKNSKEQLKALGDINYYSLSGSKLGWINCDRFARSGNITFTVNNGKGYTDVKLIFHRYKSIMGGYNNSSYSKFNRVPVGEKVTVFAIKYIDSKPFVCLFETKTSRKVVQLEFEELTKEGLKDITKRISDI